MLDSSICRDFCARRDNSRFNWVRHQDRAAFQDFAGQLVPVISFGKPRSFVEPLADQSQEAGDASRGLKQF